MFRIKVIKTSQLVQCLQQTDQFNSISNEYYKQISDKQLCNATPNKLLYIRKFSMKNYKPSYAQHRKQIQREVEGRDFINQEIQISQDKSFFQEKFIEECDFNHIFSVCIRKGRRRFINLLINNFILSSEKKQQVYQRDVSKIFFQSPKLKSQSILNSSTQINCQMNQNLLQTQAYELQLIFGNGYNMLQYLAYIKHQKTEQDTFKIYKYSKSSVETLLSMINSGIVHAIGAM
ncbi:hypothetical protein SS50377_25812 [Spironucleus salmonicida]|uniref:Uncharacterized protein n=1 Tax=Spironucleus salmonicida TaxID=348837 RepID=V6LMJ3_9EUKA|nr:hypothetical protein SS50377_25812 [Spironucleus salmonicida]|eukprot:EST45428.1 Hypothetical protein SS50377_14660 [Spironucleus salmonicida]